MICSHVTGLKAQHLCGIELVGDLCGAQLSGAVVCSVISLDSRADWLNRSNLFSSRFSGQEARSR